MSFNFQGLKGFEEQKRGCSSAGRAPALQAGGQEFDPPHLHQEQEWKARATALKKLNGLIAQVVRAHA